MWRNKTYDEIINGSLFILLCTAAVTIVLMMMAMFTLIVYMTLPPSASTTEQMTAWSKAPLSTGTAFQWIMLFLVWKVSIFYLFSIIIPLMEESLYKWHLAIEKAGGASLFKAKNLKPNKCRCN